jgi:hypothetical protein
MMIKIDFEITKNRMTLKDAIHLPDNHQYTEAQIEEMKKKRFDDWYAIVTAPQKDEVVEEPVEQEQPSEE